MKLCFARQGNYLSITWHLYGRTCSEPYMLISIVNEVGGEKDFICVIQLFVLILLLFFVVLFKTDFSSCYNQILNYVSRCKLTKYGFLLFHVMVIMMAMAGIFYGIWPRKYWRFLFSTRTRDMLSDIWDKQELIMDQLN